jgi:hypothetical protein
MRIPSLIGVVLATVASTTAFIVACGGGPGSAAAQACAAWEVTTMDTNSNCTAGTAAMCRLADGWEPFAAPGFSTVFVRRCAR